MAKFAVGQRVVYTSPEHSLPTWLHVADMGLPDVVMHLNAKDERGQIKPITGQIVKVIARNDLSVDYDFAPDGWLGKNIIGFMCPETHLRDLPDKNMVLPGTLTNRVGKPVEVEGV